MSPQDLTNTLRARVDLPSSAMTTEYLGSKRSLIEFVVGSIAARVGNGASEIIDLFSGTGVVSAAFKSLGYAVTGNDHLDTCFNLTAATLLNHQAPRFSQLPETIRGKQRCPYLSVLQYLNDLPMRPGGFIHRHYSPASAKHLGYERRYFTERNAARIDSIRLEIETWRDKLTDAERALLLADLIRAVSNVSNVAGTYGCYLKSWKPRALQDMQLSPSSFVKGRVNGHEVSALDARIALQKSDARIAYADPPYTKRQYAAYYHLLETIVRWDRPVLTGSTGLRDWETHASDFCYKRRAESALEDLLKVARCQHFFLSYNDDGQIGHRQILSILGAYGRLSFKEIQLRRYRSSGRPHKGPYVTERLYHVRLS
jgi:adenine-specific DNA-methyltransferase